MAARAMMTRRSPLRTLVAALLLVSGFAAAAIDLPNALQPAIVAPGGTFTLEAPAAGQAVVLDAPEPVDLDAAWTDHPVDGARAQCEVPAGVEPGRYDLLVGGERRPDAVWVVEEIPERYRLAFVAGSTPTHLAEAIPAAHAAEALALVFIGPADDLDAAAFAAALADAPLPVVVTGIGRDAEAAHPYAVAIGTDTLLFHDPRVTNLGAADGALHRLRRATRPSRWSIAVWPFYDPFTARRAQLILFADDPVELFVSTLEEIPADLAEAPLPGFWPGIRFEPLAAGAADAMLVVEVAPAVLRPTRIPLREEESRRPGRNRERGSSNRNGNSE